MVLQNETRRFLFGDADFIALPGRAASVRVAAFERLLDAAEVVELMRRLEELRFLSLMPPSVADIVPCRS